MSRTQQINRTAFALEKLFSINEECLGEYEVRTRSKVNKGIFQKRNNNMLMDNLFIFNRAVFMLWGFQALVKRNVTMRSFGAILTYGLVMHVAVPRGIYFVNEINRITRLRMFAKKYFYEQNGNMDKISKIMNPSTPIAQLKYMTL